MILRSLTENEIALTLALSHQNGRGNFSLQGAPDMNPRPLVGEGLVPAQHRIFKGGYEEREVRKI